jgi:hypothetical protein
MALLFSTLAVALLGTVKAESSIPKPFVPEFTLQLADDFVQVTIQNQPIIPNGQDTADIFYNIRIKDHDATNWVNDTVPDPSQGIRGYIGETDVSGSTTLLKSTDAIHALIGRYDSFQVDYQIEAINGYLNTTPAYVPPIGFDPNSTPVVIVNTSGWSNTQTITIPEDQTPTSSPATPTPTAPNMGPTSPPSREPLLTQEQMEIIVAVTIAVAVIGAGLGLLVYLIKRK